MFVEDGRRRKHVGVSGSQGMYSVPGTDSSGITIGTLQLNTPINHSVFLLQSYLRRGITCLQFKCFQILSAVAVSFNNEDRCVVKDAVQCAE